MGKSVNSTVLDKALDEIGTNCTLMLACSDEPTTRAEAVSTFALASVAMSPTDFTKSDGVSGRKLTVALKSGVSIDDNGNHTHTALVDGSRLLYVTTTSPEIPLTAGNSLTFGEWEIEIQGPG